MQPARGRECLGPILPVPALRPFVELTGVSHTYATGGTLAVDGLDIKVREGEFAAVVGPSGCGKSTLLRLIAGLEDITSGELVIGDEIVNDLPPAGCSLHLLPVAYSAGRPVQGAPASIEYGGLARLWYELRTIPDTATGMPGKASSARCSRPAALTPGSVTISGRVMPMRSHSWRSSRIAPCSNWMCVT